jgi:glycine/D-amino acid oxidase-like deaminating enzyme
MALMAGPVWDGLSTELGADLEYVRAGNLAVAETAADVARLEDGHGAARAAGLASRLLTGDEVRALVPGMQGRWTAGLLGAEDGHAEPRAVVTAFARAARALGADVREHCLALGIDTRDGAVCGVETERGRVRAPQVVIAAGVWTSRLVEPLGVRLPLRVVRSSVAATRPAAPVTPIGVWGPRVAFRQRAMGSFYLGNGYRGASAEHDVTLASLRHVRAFLPAYRENWRRLRIRLGRDLVADVMSRLRSDSRIRLSGGPWATARARRGAVRAIEREFQGLFPRLAGLGVERAWAGFIELTPDLLPVLGPVRAPRGLHLAVTAGHGFSTGPVIGRLLAEAVVRGEAPFDLGPFRPSRFEDGAVQPARKVL